MKSKWWLAIALMAASSGLGFAAQGPMETGGRTVSSRDAATAAKVVSVDAEHKTVRLAHEPVKALGWSAMTMDFKVADGALLNGLKAGDAVMFELGKAADGVWQITRITRQEAKPAAP